MSIEDNLENSKEQLIRNIDLLNDSINKNSNEIDKNKLIVLLIEKYNITSIFMLCCLIEKNRKKCDRYWPN